MARYAGLTGSPDESGTKRREKGPSKAGDARVRRGLIQLAWRFLQLQKESALFDGSYRGPKAQRRTQDDDDRGAGPNPDSVFVPGHVGEVPEGVVCGRPPNRGRPRTTTATYGFDAFTPFGVMAVDVDPRRRNPNTVMAAMPLEEWTAASEPCHRSG